MNNEIAKGVFGIKNVCRKWLFGIKNVCRKFSIYAEGSFGISALKKTLSDVRQTFFYFSAHTPIIDLYNYNTAKDVPKRDDWLSLDINLF